MSNYNKKLIKSTLIEHQEKKDEEIANLLNVMGITTRKGLPFNKTSVSYFRVNYCSSMRKRKHHTRPNGKKREVAEKKPASVRETLQLIAKLPIGQEIKEKMADIVFSSLVWAGGARD